MDDGPVSRQFLADWTLSRRDLIRGTTAIAAAGVAQAIGPATLEAAARSAATAKELDRTTFSGRLGDTFQTRLDPSSRQLLTLTLVVVRDLPVAAGATAGDPNRNFVIQFSGPLAPPLAQGTYLLQNRRTGAFSVFLVPMAVDQTTRRYEAVFNRS